MKARGSISLAMLLAVTVCPIRLAAADAAIPELDPKLPSLRVVLFTPEDVEPPPNAQERLTQVARYTETFFVRWMTNWGYEPARKQVFQWRADGQVEVLFAKGDQKAAQIKDGSFRQGMVQQLARDHNIPQNSNLWWIFVYLGDEARFPNFRGTGNSKQGGWAILNYVAAPGEIRLDQHLAAGFHDQFMLKGSIHELGHAFGLPHLGPRLRPNLGNSLMGPVTRIWESNGGAKDGRGHLSEVSAAMLWKHPLFSGTSQDRGIMPDVKLQNYQARYDRGKQQIEVAGRLVSNRKAHSVIVVDDMDTKPGEYWVRGYVGRLEANGDFRLTIDEPIPSGGTYRIAFCFDNGIVTGNGQRHGLLGAIEKPYRYVQQTYRFE